MSILDDLEQGPLEGEPPRRPQQHPKGFEPGYEWNGLKGYVNTGPLDAEPKTWDQFIRDSGLDPDEVEVVGPVNVRGWDSMAKGGNTVRMHYYRLSVVRKSTTGLPDLPTLMRQARAAAKRKAKAARDDQPDRAVVVAYADPQTGKVASRGGTPELIARTAETFERLGNYIASSRAEHGVWGDCGDVVESFENAADQTTNNDLSIMSQVDTATAVEFEGVDLMAKLLPSMDVLGIGSNHCRWRKGKDNLGTPADDWGLHILRQIRRWTARLAAEQYAHVKFTLPKQHDETVAIEVAGQIIGFAHGHQVANPNQIPDWWKGQAMGGQAVAHADILVTGHFHHFRCEPVGRNPYVDRSRWWMQAPTMDNGSDWFRHRKGYDSDPALLVVTVTRDGWTDLKLL